MPRADRHGITGERLGWDGVRFNPTYEFGDSFLDIPEENTLHYLSGKVIKLKEPQIVKQFDTLDKNKQAPAEEK